MIFIKFSPEKQALSSVGLLTLSLHLEKQQIIFVSIKTAIKQFSPIATDLLNIDFK